MAVTENSFVGNGSTTNYSFTFPYLKSTDVEVQVDATVTTAWTFANATTVQFNTAPANGAKIKILRQTNVDNLTATFYAGSAIKSEDLNDNYTQNLYKTQEVGNRYFANTGGTMTGDLTLAEDVDLIFEGATDNAHETTLTVADPTADRTITIPDVTGTVVTTGDTATVTATMLAANSVDSSELVDGSVDLSHMSANSVDSDQYVDGSIDLAHMSANSVDSDQYVDGSIDHVHLANDCIDGDNIQDDVINSEHIAAGAIDLEHMASGSVDSDNIVDGTIVNADINASAAIDFSKLATGALPSGITVASANITDGTIVAGDIAADTITASQLAANSVGTSEIADAELVTLAGMQTGTASILAGGTALTATLSEINSVCDGKSSETSVTDDDTKYPTSGAVVDYVSTQLSAVGGFETIATDAVFPNTQPGSGIIVSIADAGGLVVNGSGTSTTGRTVGGSTVTINNINSQFNSSTVAAGVAMMVESTGSGQIYNYHKATLKEADLINLSTDINDFGNRYRVGTKTADNDASNDDGDLFFDTGANKMYVYDGANDSGGAWKEVTSAGDYKLLGIKDNGQAHNGTGPTFNGSNDQFDLFDGSSDASITNAGQLIVSLNGVIQKPNASYDAAGEGFALDGSDGIRFCDPPPAGSSLFITQIGSATTLTTVSDNSVTSAKIQNGAVIAAKISTGAVETAKLAADAVDGTKLADNACDSEHYTDGSIDHVHLANDCIDGDNIQDDVVNSEHIAAGAVDLEHMSSESVDEDNLYISNAGTNGQFLSKQSGNNGGLTWADAGSVGGATGVDFNDDVLARWGTGNDLQIKHTGTYSMIHDNSDDLYIQGDEIHLRSNTDNDQYLKATHDGAVELYHNNELVMGTTADGINIYPSHDKTSGAYLKLEGSGSNINLKCANDTSGSNTKFNLWTKKFSDGADVQAIQIDLWNSVNFYANYHSGWSHTLTRGSGANFYRPSNNTWGITNYYSDNGGTKTYKAMVTDAGNFSSVSDYRLKENINYITEGISVVKGLKPCKFSFIDGGTENLGFIAHEVQEVIPEAVIGAKDQMKEDGETPYYQTLTTTEIIPHLTAALKQAIEKIETLERKVADLEAR